MKQVLFNLLLAFFISGGVANAATNTLHDKPLKTAPAGTDETYVWDTGTSTLKKSTFAPFLVGDCTGFPCLDGTSDGGNYIKLWAGTGSYWTALQGGVPTANRSWRLPIAAPPSAGTTYLMNMDEYGQMGFVVPSTFLTPTGSGATLTVDASGFDGNLTTSDNTLQEVSQKVDDLIVGGGGYTNLTSFVDQTAWRLFYSDGSGDVKELALGSDGEYLKSNGAALAPSWSTPSGAAHDAVTLGADADAILGLSTQQITLDSQTANTVFAAPNGSAGDPVFRELVPADIPTLNQSTTGNAATATALQTARTIGGVSFDGSANINLPGVNTTGSQNTTGNAATATALASNPTDCTAGQYSTAIAANGNLTCAQVAYSQVSGTPTIPTVSDTAYGAGWNGDTGAASKNALYDKIETIAGGSMTYPGAGVPVSTGTAWGTSITLGTGVSAALGYAPDAIGGFLLANTYLDDPLISWDTATITETVDSPVAGTNKIGVKTGVFQAADPQLDTWAGITPGTGVSTALGNNTGAVGGLPVIIASGVYTVDTASIAANTCASAVAITASGVSTTDTILATPNAILSSIAGFGVTSAGAVRVDVYPTSGNVNFQFCNPTGTAIDPGSVTFNWRVLR